MIQRHFISETRVDGKHSATTKEIPFEKQNNAKAFFEFLEKHSNTENDFDITLKYNQNEQDKGNPFNLIICRYRNYFSPFLGVFYEISIPISKHHLLTLPLILRSFIN